MAVPISFVPPTVFGKYGWRKSKRTPPWATGKRIPTNVPQLELPEAPWLNPFSSTIRSFFIPLSIRPSRHVDSSPPRLTRGAGVRLKPLCLTDNYNHSSWHMISSIGPLLCQRARLRSAVIMSSAASTLWARVTHKCVPYCTKVEICYRCGKR